MDKRLPLAMALCLLIVLGWTLLFPAPKGTPTRPPAQAGSSAPAPSAATAAGAPSPGAPASSVAASGAPAASGAAPGAASEGIGPVITGADEPDLVLRFGSPGERGLYRATFRNRGGALVELRSGRWFERVGLTEAEKQDPEHWTQLLAPVETPEGATASMVLGTAPSSEKLAREPLERSLWARAVIGAPEAPQGVEFTLAPGTGVTFRKRFLFRPGVDVFRVELEVRNEGLPEAVGPHEFVLVPAGCVPSEAHDSFYAEPQVVAFARERGDLSGSLEMKTVPDKAQPGRGPLPLAVPLSFAGVINKYFAVLLHGAQEDPDAQATLIGAEWRSLRDEGWLRTHPADSHAPVRQVVTDLRLRILLPPPGESRTYRYDVYAGPKEREALEAAWPDFGKVIEHDLGYFNGIASVLLAVLKFFESLTGNWGVAIILLTISVRVLLFPVNRRSQSAMARYQTKMKRLQPRIEEIKKRHAKDPAAQRQEQAKLMQEEGAFPPLGGCLPMFLQIPVFIGLFAALRSSIDLRQAPFQFWIHDLAVPDRLLRIGLHLPVLGSIEYLNVLPILMVVLWIWQQKGMPMPADEQAARMQKMMMWMPVMMGFFLYNYAAGLSLYMITQSGLGIIEQKVIKKVWPLDDAERPKKRSAFWARLMEAQKQQMKMRERRPRGRGNT